VFETIGVYFMKDLDICWEILPKVSRSFSLCIRMLPKPIDEQMMISYMLYRVIDTIEDSHATLKIKRTLFNQLIKTMRAKSFEQENVELLQQSLLTSLDYTYEKPLLSNMSALMRRFYAQPLHVQKSITKWGKVMASGMYEFQQKRIHTFADQNRYSYYVAGVVGYLLNDLFYHNHVIDAKKRKKLAAYAKRFGLALQKINILRDVAGDVSSGRYYWPKSLLKKHNLDYHMLCDAKHRDKAMKVLKGEIDNALDYLYSGMYYVLSLPESAVQVRMFCLIPLFMAIESFVVCNGNSDIFSVEKSVKISRAQVEAIVAKCTIWSSSNKNLLRWFTNSMSSTCLSQPRTFCARQLLALNLRV